MMFHVLHTSGDWVHADTNCMIWQKEWTSTSWPQAQYESPGFLWSGLSQGRSLTISSQMTTFDYCRHHTILIISINSHHRPKSLGFYLHASHRVLELAVTFTVFNVLPVSAAPLYCCWVTKVHQDSYSTKTKSLWLSFPRPLHNSFSLGSQLIQANLKLAIYSLGYPSKFWSS